MTLWLNFIYNYIKILWVKTSLWLKLWFYTPWNLSPVHPLPHPICPCHTSTETTDLNSIDPPTLCVCLPDGRHGQRWPCRWRGAQARLLLQPPSSPAASYGWPRGWWHSWEGGEGLWVGERRVRQQKERTNERQMEKILTIIFQCLLFSTLRCPQCVVSLLVI